MANKIESETIIERHQVARFGNPIEFARDSETYGQYSIREGELMELIESIARLDDKAGRDISLKLLGLVKRLNGESVELRMRFKTMGNVLDKINDNMKTGSK